MEEVLIRMKINGLTIKSEKCQLKRGSVMYLGHEISKNGTRPKKSFLAAIKDAPAPCNKDQLTSFLGLAEYCSKFVKGFTEIVEPLRVQIKKGTVFEWSNECEDAFNEIKKGIVGAPTLGHFSIAGKTYVTTDASAIGAGAILTQVCNGEERIIGFASRRLRDAELSYSVIEKEALAYCWGIRHFKYFVWGLSFRVRTDHKPLVHLFKGGKGLESSVTPRISRWMLSVLEYNFEVEYVRGSRNVVADCLSRMPIEAIEIDLNEVVEEVLWCSDGKATFSEREWKDYMLGDDVLQCVMRCVSNGWDESLVNDACYKKFYHVQEELSVCDEKLFRRSQIVPPLGLRKKIMNIAHEGHLGRNMTKRGLRQSYWWPGMDGEIEEVVKECHSCAQADKSKVIRQPPLACAVS